MDNIKFTFGSPDGIEINTTTFDKRKVLKNVTIEILENSKTGEASLGWYYQDDTEEIDEPERRCNDAE